MRGAVSWETGVGFEVVSVVVVVAVVVAVAATATHSLPKGRVPVVETRLHRGVMVVLLVLETAILLEAQQLAGLAHALIQAGRVQQQSKAREQRLDSFEARVRATEVSVLFRFAQDCVHRIVVGESRVRVDPPHLLRPGCVVT